MYKYVRDDSNENSTTSGIFFSSNFTGICQRYISDDTGLHTYAVMYCANKDSFFVTDALINLVLYISEDKKKLLTLKRKIKAKLLTPLAYVSVPRNCLFSVAV